MTNKHINGFFLALACTLACLLASSHNAGAQIVPKMVIIENHALSCYLDNSNYNTSDYTYTNIHLYKPEERGRYDWPQPVTFRWNYSAFWNEVVLEIRENEYDPMPFQAIRVAPKSHFCNVYNLIPGRRYYYSLVDVRANTEYERGDFFVEGRRRMIRADYVRNIRDFGGMMTDDGHTLVYGRLYRGGALDNNRGGIRDSLFNKDGLFVLRNVLKITADIDLRWERELMLNDDDPLNDMTNCPLGLDIEYHHFPISDFGAITTRNMYGPVIAGVVDCLKRGKNVYIHCAQGADRTGVLSFLLASMAGVRENELARDYELTSFALNRVDHTRSSLPPYNYAPSVDYIKNNFKGNTLAEKVQDYLITQHGVTREQIDAFRKIMTGE